MKSNNLIMNERRLENISLSEKKMLRNCQSTREKRSSAKISVKFAVRKRVQKLSQSHRFFVKIEVPLVLLRGKMARFEKKSALKFSKKNPRTLNVGWQNYKLTDY